MIRPRHLFFSVLFVFLSACGNQGLQDEQSVLKTFATSEHAKKMQQQLGQRADAVPLQEALSQPELYGISPELKQQFMKLDNWQNLQLDIPVKEHRVLMDQDPIYVFVPNIDEKEIKFLQGFDSQGNSLEIDVDYIPEQPVITLSYQEKLDIPAQEFDLFLIPEERSAITGGHKLDSVLFHDVHEPWFKGSPEIYMIVTFIDKSGKGSAAVVELPEIEKAGRTYYINKIFHFWNQNQYQIIDVAFIEHDSNYNYKEITSILVSAAAKVTSLIVDPTGTSLAVVSLVTSVLNEVIKAIPDSFFTDSDDFIDSINTIEKYSNRSMYYGVRGDVEARISYYEVKFNDE